MAAPVIYWPVKMNSAVVASFEDDLASMDKNTAFTMAKCLNLVIFDKKYTNGSLADPTDHAQQVEKFIESIKERI